MNRVKLGFFSLTRHSERGDDRPYLEWHQLDHMPEQYPLAGIVAGQRWVSTPACRAARRRDGELLGPIHYMTLYLMAEPLQQTLQDFQALGQHLRAVGRFHEQRRARLSGPFDVTAMRAAPRVLVSDEAVAFRPNRGVYVVVREGPGTEGATAADVGAGGGGVLAERLLEQKGVAGVWSFSAAERFAEFGWRAGRHAVTVCFLDEEPLSVADHLGDVVEVDESPTAPVVFAGPFETVTPWSWGWFDGEA